MKTIALLLLSSVLSCGQNVSVSINPLALKQATTLHRWTYILELIAAGASFGADGASTQYGVYGMPARLARQGYACQPYCVWETNGLFLNSRGPGVPANLSEARMWGWKAAFAALPVGITWGVHRIWGEQSWVDATCLSLSGALAVLYTVQGVENFRLANQIYNDDVAAQRK